MKAWFLLLLPQLLPVVVRFVSQLSATVAEWLKKKYFKVNDRRKTKRVKKEKVD